VVADLDLSEIEGVEDQLHTATSFNSGNCTRRPVLACTTDSRLPGQSRSANRSRVTSMPRNPSRVISKMIA
jgi:hypothetical protein